MNKVMLIGNLGADPEIRITPQGKQVANFRIGISERWTDGSGQKQERTEWVTIVAFGWVADIAATLRKGQRVFVDGKIQTRTWDDKQSGAKRYATEVLAMQVEPIQKRERAGAQAHDDGFTVPPPPPDAPKGGDDDLPF